MSYQFGHVDRDERIDYVDEAPAEDEGYEQTRRPLSGLVVVGGVMLLFAAALWFAYHEGEKHAAVSVADPGNVPLIRADPDPVKVKPEKAGGMEVPDKDNPIYALRPGGPPVERIMPPAEAPAPRPAPAPQVQNTGMPAPPVQLPPTAALPSSAAPRAVAPPGPAPRVPAAAAVPARIQLASMRSPDAARDEWTRLKREYGDLLGKLNAVAVRADLGERGIYYRVEAGPLADQAAAAKLCNALRGRGLECSLVR